MERLYALHAFEAGEPILVLEHVRWRPGPDSFTLEHINGHYFFDPLLPMIAHAEDPNARLSSLLMALIARRDIAAGERLTRDYRTIG
ncbi:MAG TPA: SET domain-containing protein [Caulobacteraceae bacterium]